jgi:hypothetical protein
LSYNKSRGGGEMMSTLKPITIEYIRRFATLLLLAFSAWMFFYSPLDIYEFQVSDHTVKHRKNIESVSADAPKNILDEYMAYKMKKASTKPHREHKIVEVEGRSKKFLNQIFNAYRGKSQDDFMAKHRSPDTFWSGNSYFFRSGELPENFLSQTFLKHPDYLMIKEKDGTKRYFKLYKTESSYMLNDAPVSISHPLRSYSYMLILVALLIYIVLPRPKIPQGAVYYIRFNTVYLADALGVFLWFGAWMFFFLPDDSAPVFVRYFLLSFFGIFALAIILPTLKYAASWYLFTEDSFQWSGKEGIGEVPLKNIISIKPYKKQLPKWIAPLIILFGRGEPVATGAGMISMSSSPEIGMEITLKSGKKIKIMANYLEGNKLFSERFQELEKKLKRNKSK